MLEYQNIKTLLQKIMLQIGLKKFLLLIKLKTMCCGHMLLTILKAKKLVEHFMKKNCKKTNQDKFRTEKVIERKSDKLYVKWKGYADLFDS